MLRLKLQILSRAKIILNNIEVKVGKMGQSAKKRIQFKARPKSKKTQLKFAKRQKNNYIVLDKLTNK